MDNAEQAQRALTLSIAIQQKVNELATNVYSKITHYQTSASIIQAI